MTDGCPLTHDTGCHWCGKELTGRQRRWCSESCKHQYRTNHRFTDAKKAVRQRVTFYKCERCGELVERIEVNHKVPCKGQHARFGCWHHLDNLEALCVPCHRKATAEQRERGEL